jgi:HK97 family phage prohead protease
MMWLPETVPPREVAANGLAIGERRIPAAVLTRWRQSLTCAECRQAVAMKIEPTRLADRVYHPSCARRALQRQTARPTATTAADRVVGVLVGAAVPFGINGAVPDAQTGTRYERIAPGAFRASIARGGQFVDVDHDGVAIPGRLTFVEEHQLSFRLQVFDTARGRWALERARRGEFRGASVAFRNARERYGEYTVIQVESADLRSIALCHRGWPAWHSTSVRVE